MKKLIIIALLLTVSISCEDFEGFNDDPKHPTEVSGAYLFSNAEKRLAQRLQATNVNSEIFKLYAQHWTQTQYTDESNYDLVRRNVGGNFWTDMYYDVLANTTDAKKQISNDNSLIGENQAANQLAIINIFEVYVWHVLVDTFGDVPYSEALKGLDNLTPTYDNDEDIYMDLFARLDVALVTLEQGGVSFGSADLFYDGNVNDWIIFANSLKLKLALRISDYDATMAATKAQEAFTAGVIDSNAKNFSFPFYPGPPNTNPLWVSLVESKRNDYVPAATLVDMIVGLNDPRTKVYFDDNVTPYKGGAYGAGASFQSHTHIGELFLKPELEGLLMSYSEIEFLIAEASARGFLTEDAEEHYIKAIEANMDYWEISDADTSDYLEQSEVSYDANNWKKSIGDQKWLSLYTRGFEAWNSWKLLDYPNNMVMPPDNLIPVPRRYIYPDSEIDLNGVNYEAASSAIGGDDLESKVFWDITGQGN